MKHCSVSSLHPKHHYANDCQPAESLQKTVLFWKVQSVTNTLMVSTWWRPTSWVTFVLKGCTMAFLLHLHCSVVQVPLASNCPPLSVYPDVVSSEVCVSVLPVRSPLFVWSLLCGQQKTEECQPASIQLLLSYWYSGHTQPSWGSVARAKEECEK